MCLCAWLKCAVVFVGLGWKDETVSRRNEMQKQNYKSRCKSV